MHYYKDFDRVHLLLEAVDEHKERPTKKVTLEVFDKPKAILNTSKVTSLLHFVVGYWYRMITMLVSHHVYFYLISYDSKKNEIDFIGMVETTKQRTHDALSTQLLSDRAEVRIETKCALAMLGYTMRCRVRGLIPFMDKFAHILRSLPIQKDWERKSLLIRLNNKKNSH